ncbi:hypothetical protein BJ546DRAFT_1059714 [Cryomyces antarcticus]
MNGTEYQSRNSVEDIWGPQTPYEWTSINHKDRSTDPLIRKHGKLERASWDEALDLIVEKTKEIRKRLTAHGIAIFTSGQLFLEECYVLAMKTKLNAADVQEDYERQTHLELWLGATYESARLLSCAYEGSRKQDTGEKVPGEVDSRIHAPPPQDPPTPHKNKQSAKTSRIRRISTMASPFSPLNPSSDPSSKTSAPQFMRSDLINHKSVNADKSMNVHASGRIENPKPLFLLGGQSTRMGAPKHLLPWLDGGREGKRTFPEAPPPVSSPPTLSTPPPRPSPSPPTARS